jgi:hypothetical protein
MMPPPPPSHSTDRPLSIPPPPPKGRIPQPSIRITNLNSPTSTTSSLSLHSINNDNYHDDIDEFTRPYKKLKDMLPEAVVIQKMTADGFSKQIIDDFVSGKIKKLLSPKGNHDSDDDNMKNQINKFKSTQAFNHDDHTDSNFSSTNSNNNDKNNSNNFNMLNAINNKRNLLKKLEIIDDRMNSKSNSNSSLTVDSKNGGLLGMLAQQMSQRRLNMHKHEKSDSDNSDSSGWDSESDED